MPRTSKNDTPVAVDIPEAEIRQTDLDGYSVTFNTFRTDSDSALAQIRQDTIEQKSDQYGVRQLELLLQS